MEAQSLRIENAVGECPEVKVRVGGVDVGCLIDTGAEVSTIMESFYKEFLARVKPEKCQLFRKKVHYLGHVVTREGTSPDPEKVRAVWEWPRPESLRDLRGFLGLSGYYRRFLEGYAKVAGPLQPLLQGQGGAKKGKKVARGTNPKGDGSVRDKWDPSCETAFVKLKQMLTDLTGFGP
ncbi:hypothetical protein ACROYT_G025657 [Oculina patagonica]